MLECQGRPAPRIVALVLAAGRSSRMSGVNKLLLPVSGVPMVRRVVDAALASRCFAVTVVTGHEAESVRAALADAPVDFSHNPDFAGGLSTSLRRGLHALPADAEGAVVLLADMPRVAAAHVDALIAAFRQRAGIIVPALAGRRGNPVLWPRRYFAEIQAITGDTGARVLLERYADEVRAIEIDTDAIFIDVDTPAALAEVDRA